MKGLIDSIEKLEGLIDSLEESDHKLLKARMVLADAKKIVEADRRLKETSEAILKLFA